MQQTSLWNTMGIVDGEEVRGVVLMVMHDH